MLHACSRLFIASGRPQLTSSSTHLEEFYEVLFPLISVLSSSTPSLLFFSPLKKKKKKKKLFSEVLYNQFQPDLSLVSVLVAKSSSYFSTGFVWREQCNKDAVCPCLQHSGNE